MAITILLVIGSLVGLMLLVWAARVAKDYFRQIVLCVAIIAGYLLLYPLIAGAAGYGIANLLGLLVPILILGVFVGRPHKPLPYEFFVDQRPGRDGAYCVHQEGCALMPPRNQCVSVGKCASPQAAIDKAAGRYPVVFGCRQCTRDSRGALRQRS
jgi:hypothetical protein